LDNLDGSCSPEVPGLNISSIIKTKEIIINEKLIKRKIKANIYEEFDMFLFKYFTDR